MKRFFPGIAVILITAAIFLVQCTSPSNDVVATVGSETITVKTLQDDMLRAYRVPAAARKQTLETRLTILQTMVTTQLKKLEAAERGLRDMPEMKEKEQKYIESEAVNRLYELEVVNTIASDAIIADYYEKDKMEMKAAHILLVWPTDATAEDSADVRMRADEIYQKALQSGDFSQLASEYTEEPGGDGRGGDLGWFGWGRMTPAFQEVVWEMKIGAISKPVETRFGIHIIRLEDRRKKDLPPLADVRLEIQQKIMQSQRQLMTEIVDAYFVGLRQQYEFTYTDKLDELLTLVNMSDPGPNPFSGLDTEVMDWVVGTSTIQNFTVRDMEKKVTDSPRSGIEFPDRKALEDLVDGIAIPIMLTENARKMGLFEDQGVLDKVELVIARDLEGELTRTAVDEKINVTEDMLLEYFNQHPDEFMNKPTVQVQEIFVSDEEKAQELVARARAGVNFKRLAANNTERSSAKSESGVLPPFPPGRYGEMGKKAFSLEVGDIAGPIKLGSKYSVIKVLEKKPATPQTFDEAKKAVRTTLENGQREEAQRQLMELLTTKYTVTVDTQRVQTLFL